MRRIGGTNQRGGLLIMTLVFVVMFLTIFVALAGMVNRTYHESVLQAQDETAFQVAEAGLNYGRWRLAHDPDNFASETKSIDDQLAGALGEADITFGQPQTGSTIVTITAKGRTATKPERQVTLKGRYGIPSLARYALVTNGDARYASVIKGAVHANGGIRMDGISDSIMTSAKETYLCSAIHGCGTSGQIKPGIWGVGEKKELWQYPVAPVDFNAITMDLLKAKETAQAAGTYYGPSGKFGYQVIFNSNNTYTIATVKKLGPKIYSAGPGESSYMYASHDVGETQAAATKAVPKNGIIFVEDTVWVRGEVRDRVTLAAGKFPDTPATNVDIVLNGNITYGGVYDGSRSFAAIAQRNILIPWSGAPDVMTIEGAYIAQKGSFHRRFYPPTDPSGAAYRIRTKMIRYGMIASNGSPATAWLGSSGEVISGFRQGETTYDPNFVYGPPPYFPSNGQYEFISWEESS